VNLELVFAFPESEVKWTRGEEDGDGDGTEAVACRIDFQVHGTMHGAAELDARGLDASANRVLASVDATSADSAPSRSSSW
jgi:hypothetical protein